MRHAVARSRRCARIHHGDLSKLYSICTRLGDGASIGKIACAYGNRSLTAMITTTRITAHSIISVDNGGRAQRRDSRRVQLGSRVLLSLRFRHTRCSDLGSRWRRRKGLPRSVCVRSSSWCRNGGVWRNCAAVRGRGRLCRRRLRNVGLSVGG